MFKRRPSILWLSWPLLLAVLLVSAACSRSEQLLLAENNRDGTAEIFLADLDADDSEWQLLAEDAERTFIFAGEMAMFVPDTDRILLWYVDGNDVRIEQMQIGDEAPTELFEASVDYRMFASLETDPFTVFVTETRNFDNYRCYVSQDGAKAERFSRSTFCVMNENGVVLVDYDVDKGTTVTVASLDGEEETVVLDEVEDVGSRIRYNAALTQFAYAEVSDNEAQLFSIEPGADEGAAVGETFAVIDTFGFLGDGETLYVVGKLDEADEAFGLFIDAAGDALVEADDITWLDQSEDGAFAIFKAESGGDTAVYLYNLAENKVTELVEDETVNLVGYPTEDYFLLKSSNEDEAGLYSVSHDGTKIIELLNTDEYEILFSYINKAAEQLLVQLRNADGNDAIYITSLNEDDGYFLLDDWDSITTLTASEENFIFWGREDEADDVVLYSIPWALDASAVELDDKADFGYRTAYFSADGRSLYYTAVDNRIDDFEVRFVPVDGSERAARIYRDTILLDVGWQGEPNLKMVSNR